MSLHELIETRLQGTREAVAHVTTLTEPIVRAMESVRGVLTAGGTIYTLGNGGSAAEAMHLSEELIGRYRSDRRPYRAVCMNADATALTCIANDFGFEQVFARQCEALLMKRDALVVFTTSGNSANIVSALNVARDRGATTIGLLGRDGGMCKSLCDHALIIPTDDSAHIQEAHQVIMHLLCEGLEPGR